MRMLEVTEKYETLSEEEAKNLIEDFRAHADHGGYIVKKSGYEYKTKKAKGEIIDQAWVVSVTKVYGALWDGYTGE